MDRARVHEFHFIAPFVNVPTILTSGILCHDEARRMFPQAKTVANPEIQERRAGTSVPNGEPLHSYANLYFDGRNAMMSTLRDFNDCLAILRVSPDVIDLPGVVVTDRNAAAGTATFRTALEGIARLDESEVFARWWRDNLEARQKRMAEVLVPARIEPDLIVGAYVQTESGRAALAALCPDGFPITVNPDYYF